MHRAEDRLIAGDTAPVNAGRCIHLKGRRANRPAHTVAILPGCQQGVIKILKIDVYLRDSVSGVCGVSDHTSAGRITEYYVELSQDLRCNASATGRSLIIAYRFYRHRTAGSPMTRQHR
jgi:hypothetical protein